MFFKTEPHIHCSYVSFPEQGFVFLGVNYLNFYIVNLLSFPRSVTYVSLISLTKYTEILSIKPKYQVAYHLQEENMEQRLWPTEPELFTTWPSAKKNDYPFTCSF